MADRCNPLPPKCTVTFLSRATQNLRGPFFISVNAIWAKRSALCVRMAARGAMNPGFSDLPLRPASPKPICRQGNKRHPERLRAHVSFQVLSGHHHCGMSAFAVAIGSKADLARCGAYVCLWPKTDI